MTSIRLGRYVCYLQNLVGLPVFAVFLPAKTCRFIGNLHKYARRLAGIFSTYNILPLSGTIDIRRKPNGD
jgi:hypothetical protein